MTIDSRDIVQRWGLAMEETGHGRWGEVEERIDFLISTITQAVERGKRHVHTSFATVSIPFIRGAVP